MEKEFFKLRDIYARAKRNFRSKEKYGTSAKALRTAKLKMEEFKYLQWLEEFIKPRQSKSNISLTRPMMLMKVMKTPANLSTLMRKRYAEEFLMCWRRRK